MSKKGKNRPVPTNGWDVLKAIVDGLFDLMSLSKVAAVGALWYIIRDFIYVLHLPEDYDYANNLLKIEFLEYLLNSENKIITVESSLIVVLIVFCLALIRYNKFLRKEISRMAEVRSEAIHGKEKIQLHTTSDI